MTAQQPHSPAVSTPRPDWYLTDGGKNLRWWDGARWTEHLHPVGSTSPAPGWYPSGFADFHRWWDGHQWTNHVVSPKGPPYDVRRIRRMLKLMIIAWPILALVTIAVNIVFGIIWGFGIFTVSPQLLIILVMVTGGVVIPLLSARKMREIPPEVEITTQALSR